MKINSDGCAISRRRRGAALEDAICQAAFDELNEVGYSSLTIEGVANRAQTGKASIYRRWPTKEILLREAFLRCVPTPGDVLGALIPPGATTREALSIVLNATAQAAAAKGSAVRALSSEAVRDRELAGVLESEAIHPRRMELIGLMRRGVTRGEVTAEAPIELLAELAQAFIFTRVLIRHQDLNEAAIAAFIDDVAMPLLTAGAGQRAGVRTA